MAAKNTAAPEAMMMAAICSMRSSIGRSPQGLLNGPSSGDEAICDEPAQYGYTCVRGEDTHREHRADRLGFAAARRPRGGADSRQSPERPVRARQGRRPDAHARAGAEPGGAAGDRGAARGV